MVRAGLIRRPDAHCRGLNLGCWAHLGVPGKEGHSHAEVLSVVELLSSPHEKCPSHGFDLLMRQDRVEAMELHVVTYDMHPLRDLLAGRGEPFEFEVLFHPWLFPDLEYRQTRDAKVEVCLFDAEGVSAVKDGLTLNRYCTSDTSVRVKDKVFMVMESARARVQIDPYRPVCTFWSICAPKDRDVALMTKHVLLCETATGILRQVKLAFVKLAPGSATAVLQHMEAILVATEEASKRLSRVMARSEAAFDGVPLDLGKKYDGPTEPHACWEEQLRVLCRMLDPSVHPAPVLNAMLHGKVLELLGRDVAGDGEARERGQRVWLNDRDPATLRTKAHVIHRVVTEFIHALERLAEDATETLASQKF
jgi:hypothetical protein